MRSFESREDYLEAILVLQNEKGAVRSIDIAAKLGFTKPSVSRAMGLLRGAEYITVDRDGFIRLTETGRAAAESVYERHRLLTDCLIRWGVSPETAAEDACRVAVTRLLLAALRSKANQAATCARTAHRLESKRPEMRQPQ